MIETQAPSKRALVCDDALLMRQMVVDALEHDGWDVIAEATNGLEAVELYKKHRPDVVTMDIVMPVYDGIHALHDIICYDPDAKVVMVSAVNQTRLISESIRLGAQDFVVKPFMPEQLHQTLMNCLPEVHV